MRKRVQAVSILGLILVACGSVAGAEEKGTASITPMETETPFFLIRPGTQIADGPPPAWSHFVVKAQSKLASGDLDTLPGWGAKMASKIRTVILADVGQAPDDPNRFWLRKIGIGLCLADSKGCDIVVSSDRAADLGFDLGTLEKVVLESAEAELAKGRLIISTPTFGIYRSPTTMMNNGDHRLVDIYYGFLVNSMTGDLQVVVWSRDPATRERVANNRLVQLKPNLVYECSIDVKARRLLGTIPISWSFAMQDLLPGITLTIPDKLAELMEGATSGKVDPSQLEKALRAYLAAHSAIKAETSRDASKAPGGADGSDPARSPRTSSAKSAPLGTSRVVR